MSFEDDRQIASAVERISRMEAAFDRAKELMAQQDPQKRSESEQELRALLAALDAYYTSHIWKKDFALDEEGLLPADLKRGVLSEDGIYNLLEEQKELARVAVIFPGLGYHTDKPLLYYAKKLAKQHGYDVYDITYQMPWTISEVKNDPDKMEEALDLFMTQVREQLRETDFRECSRVLFIGKSIGTAIAARLDEEDKIGAHHLAFTPVPMTFDYLDGERSAVFHGLSDPWCGNEIVERSKVELGFDLALYPDANHSLETGDVERDIEVISDVMKKVEMLLTKKF